MKYNIIGSSSKGNSIIVEDKILLDCGVTYAKIKPYLKYIKLIFVSHLHKDHLLSTTIKQIVYNYPNIKYLCGNEDVCRRLLEIGVKSKSILYLDTNKKYELELCKVELIDLYHDVPNNGLKWEINDKKGIYIVDTCKIDGIDAKNYDLYLIEANYNKDILQRHIEECDDINKLKYLERVPNTHLSQEEATSFLIENMGSNSKYEFIHKSSLNYEDKD